MIYIIEMIDNLNEVEQDGPKQDGSILRVKSLTTMGPNRMGPKWKKWWAQMGWAELECSD
jgi:hypothetical protein